MRRLFLIFILICSSYLAFAQSRLVEREREINAYYANREADLSQQLNDAKRQYNVHIQEGKSQAESQDRYEYVTEMLLNQVRSIEQQIRGLGQQRDQEIQRERDLDRALREKMQAAQNKQAELNRNAQREKMAERHQRQIIANEKKRIELEIQREEEARRARERQRQIEEEYERNYQRNIQESNPTYDRMRDDARWLASDENVRLLQQQVERARIYVSLDDVSDEVSPVTVTKSSGANRLKERLQSDQSKRQFNDNRIFDESINPLLNEELFMALNTQSSGDFIDDIKQTSYSIPSISITSSGVIREGIWDNSEDSILDRIEAKVDVWREEGKNYILSTATSKIIGFAKKTVSSTSASWNQVMRVYDIAMEAGNLKNFLSKMCQENLDAVKQSVIKENPRYANERLYRSKHETDDYLLRTLEKKKLIYPSPQNQAKIMGKAITKDGISIGEQLWLRTKKQ